MQAPEESDEQRGTREAERRVYLEQQAAEEKQRKQDFQRQQEVYEAQRLANQNAREARVAAFERILKHAPATFSAEQLRVFLRGLVNVDPYTYLEELAETLSTGGWL